jgi:hypothetical protein
LPSTLVPGYPPGLEACVMQALAKDPGKRYPSANDMLIGLTRALPSAMRESTDEEVSEFIRRLLPDRLERQRVAIKQALEAADRREMAKSAPQLNLPEALSDEPATVLEGIGREMTPSADGRSLPGASATEPPPSVERAEKVRRRTLLLAASGVTLLVGAGVGFAFGRDDSAGLNANPPEASVAAARVPSVNEPVSPPPALLAPSSAPAPDSVPVEPAPSAAPSVTASATPSAARPVTGRRPVIVAPKTSASARKPGGPFVSPIRNPGF